MLPYTANDSLRAIAREYGFGLAQPSKNGLATAQRSRQPIVTTALRALFERRGATSGR
jgi:hypothetical protein